MKFILAAMMVSRAISYYICMIVTGLYTLVYHAVGLKNNKKEPEDVDMFTALKSEKVLKELAGADGAVYSDPSALDAPTSEAECSTDGGQVEADERALDRDCENEQAQDGETADGARINDEEIQENDDGNRKD